MESKYHYNLLKNGDGLTMKIPTLNETEILQKLNIRSDSFLNDYYAFYSSWYGGMTTNPHLMLLPIDDHMVHRGDGVFEGIKAVNRGVYLLDEHLQRLLRSAERINIPLSFSLEEMKQIIIETLRVANRNDVMIRVYLSRGPGSFSPNPYDSVGSQFYVVITHLKLFPQKKYEEGVKIGKSDIPTKNHWWAQVKSCNYLPNVMMKKESVDRELDFVISIDEKGYISESATENIMLIDQNNNLVHPELDFILKGITMTRIVELAEEQGIKTIVKSITVDDLTSAKEIIMTGTTLDLIRVSEFEGHKIGSDSSGKISELLSQLLVEDVHHGPYRTIF
jgi:4-amino-4-deoxychorismate lyase